MARFLLLLLLLPAGCAPGPLDRGAPLVHQIVTSDGEVRRLEEWPAEGAPALDEATARARAAEHAPGAARATRVQARFAALTMVADREVWNFRSRPVWLVAYAGAPFVPEACSCQGLPPLTSTVVARDAGTGELVLVYGVDSANP